MLVLTRDAHYTNEEENACGALFHNYLRNRKCIEFGECTERKNRLTDLTALQEVSLMR